MRSAIGAAHWIHCIVDDERIPAGPAVSAALAIGASVKWATRESIVPVNLIAKRLQLEPNLVHDVLIYLILTGYLTDTGKRIERRRLFTPTLPETTHGNETESTTDAAAA